eukprot:Skav229432  [mRNA]  locus=scaffold2297:428272:429408:+ [translate_table: standard]
MVFSSLLLLIPLTAAQFPSCPDAVAPSGTPASTADVPVEVNVQGQSGKFTIVPKGSSGNSVGIRVTMDAIREVDSAGVPVGQSGRVKHSLNTFASQAFAVSEVEQVTLGSVSAAKISFESTISSIGSLGVDTYLIASSGAVGMDNESWSVDVGDLKWNILLWDWTWCGDPEASCKNGEVGDAIELDITVQNMGGGSASKKGDSDTTVSLGGSAELQLSTEVQTDCTWEQMADGYPMVTTQGSGTTITFRFPRFESSSLYDPVISGSCAELGLTCTDTSDEGESTSSSTDASDGGESSTTDSSDGGGSTSATDSTSGSSDGGESSTTRATDSTSGSSGESTSSSTTTTDGDEGPTDAAAAAAAGAALAATVAVAFAYAA